MKFGEKLKESWVNFCPAQKKKRQTPIIWRFFSGTPGKIRTYDLWLRKPTLYPAELQVQIATFVA